MQRNRFLDYIITYTHIGLYIWNWCVQKYMKKCTNKTQNILIFFWNFKTDLKLYRVIRGTVVLASVIMHIIKSFNNKLCSKKILNLIFLFFYKRPRCKNGLYLNPQRHRECLRSLMNPSREFLLASPHFYARRILFPWGTACLSYSKNKNIKFIYYILATF